MSIEIRQIAWHHKFEYLLQFRIKFPDRWPTAKEEFPRGNKLGCWLNEQRTAVRKGTMNSYRLEILENVNFPFSPFEDKWNRQFHFLKQFNYHHKRFCN